MILPLLTRRLMSMFFIRLSSVVKTKSNAICMPARAPSIQILLVSSSGFSLVFFIRWREGLAVSQLYGVIHPACTIHYPRKKYQGLILELECAQAMPAVLPLNYPEMVAGVRVELTETVAYETQSHPVLPAI